MHLVVDSVAVDQGSAAIVVEHLLRAWHSTWPEDRLTVLYSQRAGGPPFAVPDGVAVKALRSAAPGVLGSLILRSLAVRRAARELKPDAVLAGVPASALLGTACARGLILYDLRHELRPEQFSRWQRLARHLSWWWSMSGADGIYCISQRTLDDLRNLHPRLARRAVAAPLGSEHAADWRSMEAASPYALAFGQFANKNVSAVLDGWASFCRDHPDWRLRLVGMSAAARSTAADYVAHLGVADRVELTDWLDDEAFVECFAGAGLILFPSDFEGFGLPAVEALRLGIPLVVSTDPALAEVTGGHAAVSRSASAGDLHEAMEQALALSPAEREAGREHARHFSWATMAGIVRSSLAERATRRVRSPVLDQGAEG